MIVFECFKSPNSDFIGVYDFTHNELTIEPRQKNFIIHKHVAVSPAVSLKLKVESSPRICLKISPSPALESFSLNGKIATIEKEIKKNDSLIIGEIGLKILDFSLTEHLPLSELFNHSTKQSP